MFTVVFQAGGGRNGTWRRAMPDATVQEAEAKAASVRRMGYPAYMAETALWDMLGLPEGESPSWDYVNCKPKEG